MLKAISTSFAKNENTRLITAIEDKLADTIKLDKFLHDLSNLLLDKMNTFLGYDAYTQSFDYRYDMVYSLLTLSFYAESQLKEIYDKNPGLSKNDLYTTYKIVSSLLKVCIEINFLFF